MSIELNLAHRVERIKPSPTLAVAARAEELRAEGKAIINLSVGEPDFDTPAHIKEAAIKAIHDGHTKYTAVDGIKPLKIAICDKFSSDNQLSYQPNQILVSCGAKHSLYNLFAALLNPGDEVIIPAPYWVSYPDMVKLVDANPVIVSADVDQQFKITADQLKTAITNKTRIVILNSPSNPTGVAYSQQELAAIGAVLLAHPQIIVVTDDIYEKNLWNGEFCNIVNACPELYARTIVVNGVSKSYAMTGWRIGYAAGPAKIISAMKKVQSQSTSNPASISQYAALAALTGDQTCITEMVSAYRARHDFVHQSLQSIAGIQCLPADGTFYTFPLIKAFYTDKINNDIAFAEYVLSHAEVAVVPGSAFGSEGYMRLSYASSMDVLEEAMLRLKKLLQ